ncbi:MAG: NUDIX domain-containing protein, partial [Clostridia bacterium]|nr:NUDIX domain-containing protein [Clostridia bacterium]
VELLKTAEKTHIFTHVEWKMHCYYVNCKTPAGDFTWVDQARFEQDIALPTAFRMFWEELK